MATPPHPPHPHKGGLFRDPDGTLSASRLWYSVGNAALTAAFLNHSLRFELTPELLLAYGAVVAGSNVATRFLKLRYSRDRRPD